MVHHYSLHVFTFTSDYTFVIQVCQSKKHSEEMHIVQVVHLHQAGTQLVQLGMHLLSPL